MARSSATCAEPAAQRQRDRSYTILGTAQPPSRRGGSWFGPIVLDRACPRGGQGFGEVNDLVAELLVFARIPIADDLSVTIVFHQFGIELLEPLDLHSVQD